jgi:hypothetical protein
MMSLHLSHAAGLCKDKRTAGGRLHLSHAGPKPISEQWDDVDGGCDERTRLCASLALS